MQEGGEERRGREREERERGREGGKWEGREKEMSIMVESVLPA